MRPDHSPMAELFVLLAIVFGAIAGLMAYLIMLEEYAHHYSDNGRPRMLALRAAAFAFLVFFALALTVGYVFTAYL